MNKIILPLGILLVQVSLLGGLFERSIAAQYQGYGNRYQNPQANPYGNQTYPPQGFRRGYGSPPIIQGNVQPGVVGVKPAVVDPKKTPTPASIIRYAAQPLKNYRLFPRLPGEFEKQKAVLLSVSDLMYQHNGVLTQIVEKTSKRVPLIILFNDGKQLESTVELLETVKADLSHVSLYKLKLDTIWLRDFGPQMAESGQDAVSTDFYYNGQRPLDDKFPLEWGERSGAEINKVEWTMQGGNLLSNGKGLSIASSRIFVDNFIGFPESKSQPGFDVEYERRKLVVDSLKKDCNINQLIVLEPLVPESTQHVDMFATFLAEDHILIASVDPRRDPVNARILNNNAALLKQVKVDGKPLKVDRIQIPIRQDKYWSPYTNIIYSNGTVLFPRYKSDPPELVRNAIRTYERLIPGVHVDTVDMTTMQKLEGALHCMSINLPVFSPLPKGIMTFEEAKAKVASPDFVANDSSKEPKKKVDSRKKNQGNSKQIAVNPPSSNKVKKDAKPNQEDAKQFAKSNSLQNLTVKKDKQFEAVQTYRRKFVDGSNRFGVEAYAVGFQPNGVVLIRVDTGQEIFVLFESLCSEDRDWLSKNRGKITTNGLKVKRYLQNNGLN